MKLTTFLCALGLFISTNLYAGPYDGVWVIDNAAIQGEYQFVRQNGNQIVVANLHNTSSWDALIGSIDGNQAELRTIINPDDDVIDASVEFSSETTGTIIVNSCQTCGLPLNLPIPIKKIF